MCQPSSPWTRCHAKPAFINMDMLPCLAPARSIQRRQSCPVDRATQNSGCSHTPQPTWCPGVCRHWVLSHRYQRTQTMEIRYGPRLRPKSSNFFGSRTLTKIFGMGGGAWLQHNCLAHWCVGQATLAELVDAVDGRMGLVVGVSHPRDIYGHIRRGTDLWQCALMATISPPPFTKQ